MNSQKNFKKILLSIFFVTNLCMSGWAEATNVLAELKKIPQNALIFLYSQLVQYQVKPTYEQHLTQNYLQRYYLPWHHPLVEMPLKDLKEDTYATVNDFKINPGWNENGRRHSKQWIIYLEKNMDLAQFPNHQANAITINQTNLRLLPTEVPSFSNSKKAGQGFPFDNLQISMLRANVPIYIVQTTKDGAWNLVITSGDSEGWAQTKDIAIVDQQFIKHWQATGENYLTPILGRYPIKSVSGQYYFSTRIGEIYPLQKRGEQYDEIWVAARDVKGHAVMRDAQVSHKVMRRWPIAATAKNIAQLANQFLGIPYGWGEMYGYRDCSSTLEDLFAPFAIWLPRHSTQQAETGIVNDIANKTAEEKKQLLLEKGIPFFTLLWLRGHILLYIGQWHNHPIVFHSPWGVPTRSFFSHKAGRIVIGRTVISPLNLGQGNLDVPKTWLDQIRTFTYLIPPEQLIKHPTIERIPVSHQGVHDQHHYS